MNQSWLIFTINQGAHGIDISMLYVINYTVNAYLIKPRYNMLQWDIVLLTPQQFHTLDIFMVSSSIWKHFPRYWPFVRGIHRSLVNFPHKSQWCGAPMFFLLSAPEQGVGWTIEMPVIWDAIALLWRHCDVMIVFWGFRYDCSGINWWSCNGLHCIFTCESLTNVTNRFNSQQSMKPSACCYCRFTSNEGVVIWKFRWKTAVNSLAPGWFYCSPKFVNFKLISTINILSILCKIAIRWMPQYLTDH